ncbi:MAG: hypothetical protein AB7H93_08350 [Vicinamibacterales bacterium]
MATHRRLGAAILFFLSAATVPARQEPDREVVRERLLAYLDGYEQELSTLIAEERLRQWPIRRGGAGAVVIDGVLTGQDARDTSRVRSLVSDVAFVPLPGNAGWLGYRDVTSIGGRAVRRNGPALLDLLKAQTDDSRERAMTLLLESARDNLGAARTINLPSLPLELLHRRNQGRFAVTAQEMARTDHCATIRLMLEETVTPTLIQSPAGGNMPSRVFAWVEPESGRLCRAEVRTRDAQHGARAIDAVVRVEFAREPVLDVWVPEKMYEEFLYPPRDRGEGEAVYTNYRRFTTSARIVPQP